MKERKEGRGRFTGRRFIRASLIVAAGIIVAAAIIAGPCLAPSMAAESQKPIKLGLFGATSGGGGMTGEAARRAVEMWTEDVNSRGGLLGRKVEFVQRDTGGKPEEAVRWARDFAASDIDFFFAHGSSAEGFAVASISKELKKITFAVNNATEFTADPKVRSPYCFRTARNNLLDNIVMAKYAAAKSKEFGLKRWYTIAGDYSQGRDSVALFIEFLKKFNPDVQIVGQAWPKLGEADYTTNITAMMATKPDAVFDGHWGLDMATFVKQAAMYGFLDKSKFFLQQFGEYLVINPMIEAMGKIPAGLYGGTMYVRIMPDTKANRDFYNAHVKRFGAPPLNLTWENYTACLLLEAAVNKAKTTETEAVVRALKDLTVKAPTGVGPNGTVTMRGRDGQLINYGTGFGVTISEEPYLKDIVAGSWDEILKEETAYLKNKGWLQ